MAGVARGFLLLLVLVGSGACAATYRIPRVSALEEAKARNMFAEERRRFVRPAADREAAAKRFLDTVARVEPVAERVCREETRGDPGFDCDILVLYNSETLERNAYFFYRGGKPVVGFTVPMIFDARNEDEIAFILGHEMGHHIGKHLQKEEKRGRFGAAIAGALIGLAQAGRAEEDRNYWYEAAEMRNFMAMGDRAGRRAFSSKFELEADVIGTWIAKEAGYDPVRGARFFARPEAARMRDGRLSFWGTHPPDAKRLATVIATLKRLETDPRLRRTR